jgi:NAD-dependent deacetylase sirtuin 5
VVRRRKFQWWTKYNCACKGVQFSFSSEEVPTFRGAGGMWRKYRSTSLATPEAFEESPSRVWQFYHYRREKCALLGATPNFLPPIFMRVCGFTRQESFRCNRMRLISRSRSSLCPRSEKR